MSVILKAVEKLFVVTGAKGGVAQAILTMMRRVLRIVAVGLLLLGASAADAGVWRWNDDFLAAFVDAEGSNLPHSAG